MVLSKSQFFCLGLVAVAYYYKITFSQNVEDGPVVTTSLGKVKGATLYSRGGRKFHGFMKLPFAQPPTGNRRFEPPEPAERWEGIRDGREFGPRCLQLDSFMGVIQGEEDCLTINVFSPVVEARAISKPLPVIVYFHGGFFHNGGADFWKANYFMDEDVIFVTLNFRLAALGFLNTGDSAIRGNMGLKDQTMGLRWVQENIGYFGGDPNKVTLLGESAGAVCSHLHMFSSMSKGLFNNIISQSGSALHFWAILEEPKRQAERFASSVGCPFNDTAEIKSCLKKLDPIQLIEGHREMMDPLRESIAIFKPSVEVDIRDGNTFLAEKPTEMAKRGDFTKVPWVTGVNSEEGLVFSAAMLVNKTMQTVAQEDWGFFLDRTIWFPSEEETAEKVRHFYFGDDDSSLVPANVSSNTDLITKINMNPLERLDSYTNMISDRGFFYDAHHGASMQSIHSPVYLYYYSYRGKWSVVNFFPEISGTFNRQLEVTWSLLTTWVAANVFGRQLPNYGASHSDELSLLFYMPWVSEIYAESQDYDMSLDLVKLWADFADNDSHLKFRNVEWPVVNASHKEVPLQYMKIDSDPMVIDEPFTHRIQFWSSLLD
ncbi:esterase E4 [Folsomia candida]|uniref:Carboxylic ester hydrolase n=1 Tax=Folsomia candida TaxID=158441 RepID=A0A226E419_FOLCA|nr:esterase E4 [Folsomia candida]OXA51774.1 Esterase E4 [Folsomia candida]